MKGSKVNPQIWRNNEIKPYFNVYNVMVISYLYRLFAMHEETVEGQNLLTGPTGTILKSVTDSFKIHLSEFLYRYKTIPVTMQSTTLRKEEMRSFLDSAFMLNQRLNCMTRVISKILFKQNYLFQLKKR